MALRLLLGRAGTGKTRRCLNEIKQQLQADPLGPPLLLIVPAQESFSMERELASLNGGMRVQVYSFRRLAHRVLRETRGAALRPVSELGRRMMLKSILLREKGNLNLLGALQNRPGFLTSLSELVGECKMCRVAPEDIAGLLSPEQGRLEMKIKDFGHVYQKLGEELAGRFTDPDDYLDLLAEQVSKADLFKGCRVWVDGFSSFTPQEYAAIKALVGASSEVAVTLCLNEEAITSSLADHHPFVKPKETYLRLQRLALEQRSGVRCEFMPDRCWRFAQTPDLAHLEQFYFAYPSVTYQQTTPNIQMAAGVNIRAEVEGVARSIRRLIRLKNLRPREIMVAVRDVEVYFPLLQRVLADYEIPFFIDHRRSVMHHPLVELIRSAVEVWQAGWNYDPVFRFLKTGLTGIDREDVDRLENYVLAAGIRGAVWYGQDDWKFVPGRQLTEDITEGNGLPDELIRLNRIRRKAVLELRVAQVKVKAAAEGRPARLAAREWARVLVELCLDLGIPERLDRWSRAALEQGQPELAREHRQVWRLVNGLWDELVETLGEERLTGPEFIAILDAGLEALSLSLIPPTLDAVTVGSLDRSRPPRELKALFIPGLSEGALPAAIRSYGVFTERERELLSRRLAEKNLELPPGTRDRLHQEQFLIYRAFTRTGGLLVLSHPLGDDEGKAVTAAPVIRRIRELFPALKGELLPADPPGGFADAEYIEHPAGLLPRLALRWREAAWGRPVHPLWWRIYNLLAPKQEWRGKLGMLAGGLAGRNMEKPLPGELGLRMWTRQDRGRRIIVSSISRLERFVSCPFAHFLSSGLGLEQRSLYRLAPPDTGQLYHEAMRLFVERVATVGPGWDQLDREQVYKISAELVDSLAPRLQGSILLSSARLRRHKERLLERVGNSALAVARQMQGSGFRPVALEVYFGPRGKDAAVAALPLAQPAPYWPDLILPPLELDLGGGSVLALGGRIDRVDLGSGDSGFYLRIIDYKSGVERLDLRRVLAGAQLQLLVYLWVALEHFERFCAAQGYSIDPAGAFYFSIQRPLLELGGPGAGSTELEQAWLKEFKLNGLVVDLGEELFRILDHKLAPGTSSLLVPAGLNKDGSVSGRYRSQVYSASEFQCLIASLGQVIKQIGCDIVQGRVDIAPLKMGKVSACRFCPYIPVCRFDAWLPENRHRTMEIDAGELRRLLTQESVQEGGVGVGLYQLD